MYRYAHRDPITRTVSEYSLVSFYSDLEGFNFNDVNQTYHSFNNETDANNYLLDTANNFIEKGYKAVAHEMVFTNIVTSITSYLLFVLVASLLLKGIYLLKKNKGFKFTQSIKITLIASIQSLSIAIVLALSGMNFINALGISLAIRILYIYVRYTGSRKNTKWLEELYLLTNEERFKIANENTNNISK